MSIVLPGDSIPLASSSSTIKLGPGLLPSQSNPETTLTVIRPGALGHLSSSSSKSKAKQVDGWWVETNTNRYIPAPGDSVIGQITNRGSESYTVTLFSAHSATLPALAFEGATKRHKPNLKIGQLVYAKIVSADRFTEPELTCVNPDTGKSDGFGDLKTVNDRGSPSGVAMLWKVSLGLSRSLLRPNDKLLATIASHFPFEAAIGHNGMVWIRASNPKHVIAVGKVLEYLDQKPRSFYSSQMMDPSQQMEIDQEVTDAETILKNRTSLRATTLRQIVTDYL